MPIDTRILHRHADYEVLAHRQTICWPNGDVVGLHPVYCRGHAAMFLRATRHDDLHWIVFDLRDVTAPVFEAECKALPRADLDGMVLYTLRLGYRGAAPFLAAALRHRRADWSAGDHATPSASVTCHQ